jgi:hypothetical protein
MIQVTGPVADTYSRRTSKHERHVHQDVQERRPVCFGIYEGMKQKAEPDAGFPLLVAVVASSGIVSGLFGLRRRLGRKRRRAQRTHVK